MPGAGVYTSHRPVWSLAYAWARGYSTPACNNYCTAEYLEELLP